MPTSARRNDRGTVDGHPRSENRVMEGFQANVGMHEIRTSWANPRMCIEARGHPGRSFNLWRRTFLSFLTTVAAGWKAARR